MMHSNRLSLLGSTPNKTPINTGSLETPQLPRGPPKIAGRTSIIKRFYDNWLTTYHIWKSKHKMWENWT